MVKTGAGDAFKKGKDKKKAKKKEEFRKVVKFVNGVRTVVRILKK